MSGELLGGSSGGQGERQTGALELRLRNSYLGLEFRGLTRSGVRSSVFTLCSSALGAGCLSLPYAVRVAGLGFSIVVMIIATCLTVLSSSVIVRHAAAVRGRRGTMAEPGPVPAWGTVLEEQLGRCGGPVVDGVIFLLAGGVIVLYYSFTGDFLVSLRDLLDIPASALPRWLLIFLCLPITVPLGFPQDIGALQASSIFIVGVLVAMAILATAALAACRDVPYQPVAWGPQSWSGLLQAFCTSIFTLMFHLNIFTVYNSLREPHLWSPRSREPRALADKERMENICIFAVVVCVVLNVWIALSGYLLWRGRTLQDFILSYTREPGCPAWITTSAHVVQVLLALCTILGVPINTVPARQALASLVSRACGSSNSWLQARSRRYPLTAVMCTALAALAATTSAVATIIGFLGGALSTVVMFVLPALFYAGGNLDQGKPCRRTATLAALMLGAIAGFGNVAALIAKSFSH